MECLAQEHIIYYKGGRLSVLSSPLSRWHVINFCCPTCLYSCLWVCVLNWLFLVCMCKNVCFFLPYPCTVKVHNIYIYSCIHRSFLCVCTLLLSFIHLNQTFLHGLFNVYSDTGSSLISLYAHYILSFIHCNQTLLVHRHKLECFFKTNWIVMFKVKVQWKLKIAVNVCPSDMFWTVELAW